MSSKDATSACAGGQVHSTLEVENLWKSIDARASSWPVESSTLPTPPEPATDGRRSPGSKPGALRAKWQRGAAGGRRSRPTPPPPAAECEASTVFLIHGDKVCHSVDKPLYNRLERLAKAKSHSLASARFASENLVDEKPRAVRQANCSTWLAFRLPAGEGENWRLQAANFCDQVHTCEGCAIARAGRLLQSGLRASIGLLNERPWVESHFVTLTVRNGEDLGETYERLNGGLVGIRDRRQKGRGGLSHLVGGFGQIETKIGKGGNWHPHYHGVWFFSKKPDYRELQKTWSAAVGSSSGASFKLMEADRLRIEKKIARSSDEYREAFVKGLCEVIKYTCKFTEQELPNHWHAATYYRGRRARLFRRFGDVVGVEEPEGLADECPDWEQVQYQERIFKYAEEHGRYVDSQGPRSEPNYHAWQEVQG